MTHLQADFAYYAAFLSGQGLFVLKRAASAIRSKTNPIKSRRAYAYANWDILLIRASLELPIFWIYRHESIGTVAGWMGLNLPVAFSLPVNPLVAVMIGYLSD